MELVIALSRSFLYLLLVSCLHHAICFPHGMEKTDFVTEAFVRTVESELTTTVTESVSLNLQTTELADKTENASNKKTTKVEDNKQGVSSTSPIDISNLFMGTEPRGNRHAKSKKRKPRTVPKLKQIYSKWQLFLSIDKDGRVYGTGYKNVTMTMDDTTIFEISHVPSMQSLVLLKGRASSLFLCINSTGHMVGKRVPTGDCYFQENIYRNDGWTSFSSCEYPSSLKHSLCRGKKRKGWMIALNKDGSPKNTQTAWQTKKRSTRFLKTDVPIKRSTSR